MDLHLAACRPSPGLNIAAPCLPPLFKAIILTGDKHEHGVMASY